MIKISELNQINTVDDVAKYLKISTTTVHRLIRKGELRTIKALGKLRITKQAVEEFIAK